ncbi:MAG: hypothetical protein ABIH23_13915 [bacterium]
MTRNGIISIFCATMFLLACGTAIAQVEQLPIRSGPEAVGIRPITGDVNLWFENGGGSKYWRPDCDTLSNGNAIVFGGMRKDPGWLGSESADSRRAMREMIAIFSPTGELLEPARTAFYTNAGEPWEDTICTTRNEDKFYGLCADTVGERNGDQYVVHTIATPHDWPEAFPGYPVDAAGDHHTAIQVISNGGEIRSPLTSPYGTYLKERGLLRGGTVRFLSSGNIVVLYEDRQQGERCDYVYGRTSTGQTIGAAILGPDGHIVHDMFPISTPRGGSNRFGLASGDGWFACRYFDNTTGATIVAFDNDGNELGGGEGRLYPAIDIPELKGDGGNRGDPNGLEAVGDTLYISHQVHDREGYLSTFRVSEDGVQVIKTVSFIDNSWSTFEHNADLGVDSEGNVIVMWQDQAWDRFQPGRWELLARMFDANLEPLTSSFVLFEVGNNTDIDEIDPILGPGRTKQSRIAMNDQIIVAIAETNEVPYGDAESFTSGSEAWYTYTYIARLLENPTHTPVRDWSIY